MKKSTDICTAWPPRRTITLGYDGATKGYFLLEEGRGVHFKQIMTNAEELTADEEVALRELVTLKTQVTDVLRRLSRRVRVGEFEPGNREIESSLPPAVTIAVTFEDIECVIRRYLRGQLSGHELSNWAGLLLALPVYALPHRAVDDAVLELLTDLALPLDEHYLDRDELQKRITGIRYRA